MGIFDPWAGFGVTFNTMFRKTFTQEYPAKGKEKVTWHERAVTIPSAYAAGIKPGQFLLALRKRSEREFYEENEPLWGALPMFVFTDTNKTKLVSVLGQRL